MTQKDQTNDTATQRGRAAIYARVAPGARTQTAPPQTAALIALANEQGFPNERIILYEDKGVSSNTAIFKREAFDALIRAVRTPQQEPIQSMLVSSEDRLKKRLVGGRARKQEANG